eukprot:gene49956-7761_t
MPDPCGRCCAVVLARVLREGEREDETRRKELLVPLTVWLIVPVFAFCGLWTHWLTGNLAGEKLCYVTGSCD